MSQDLSYIKGEIKNCEEVDSPYDIKIGQTVKYITIKNGDEYFFDGGIYVKMGDNNITLKVDSKDEKVQLVHYNKDGFIVYRTRLFVENMKGGGTICSNKDSKEYEKIIKTQQQIIEKMNIQMKKQHEYIMNIQNNQ